MPPNHRGVYPADWNALARQIKEEAGWRCVRCGHSNDWPAGYGLTVHHLDNDKANCEWWNLAALCQRCHLRIQVAPWLTQCALQLSFWPMEKWIIPYIEGRRQALAIEQEVTI